MRRREGAGASEEGASAGRAGSLSRLLRRITEEGPPCGGRRREGGRRVRPWALAEEKTEEERGGKIRLGGPTCQ